jgi:hypothetical protein
MEFVSESAKSPGKNYREIQESKTWRAGWTVLVLARS